MEMPNGMIGSTSKMEQLENHMRLARNELDNATKKIEDLEAVMLDLKSPDECPHVAWERVSLTGRECADCGEFLNDKEIPVASEEKGLADGMWTVRKVKKWDAERIHYGPNDEDFFRNSYGPTEAQMEVRNAHNEIVAERDAKIESLENQLRG